VAKSPLGRAARNDQNDSAVINHAGNRQPAFCSRLKPAMMPRPRGGLWNIARATLRAKGVPDWAAVPHKLITVDAQTR